MLTWELSYLGDLPPQPTQLNTRINVAACQLQTYSPAVTMASLCVTSMTSGRPADGTVSLIILSAIGDQIYIY